MKDHEASITFQQKTWQQACVFFMLPALIETNKKPYFLQCDVLVKTLYTTLYMLLQWKVFGQLLTVTPPCCQ